MEAIASDNRVGIAVVENAGRYLVGVRDADGPLAGYSEFPGGKCRPGESPAACAIRETLEETGLHVTIAEPLFECRHDYPHGSLDLHFFLCRPASGAPLAADHCGFVWVDAFQLSELTFPPANQRVILKLLDRQSAGDAPMTDVG